MATLFDLIEVTSISDHTTYSTANGNLLGVVESTSSSDLNDGEFDAGDTLFIGGVAYTIDRIQEPASSGHFRQGDGSQRSFTSRDEDDLDVIFLTVSNGGTVRHFIIPNDRYGDMNVEAIHTGELEDVAGSDAAILSTQDNDVAIVCFASGTRIAGPTGAPVAVETLRAGDSVMTADHGVRPVLWTGRQDLEAPVLRAHPHLAPIRIAPGALGPGQPRAPLLVSPQHRVLARSKLVERMFGVREVLIAARHLLALGGVDVAAVARVTYVHVLLARHEVLFAEGAACESLYLGPQALAALGARRGGAARARRVDRQSRPGAPAGLGAQGAAHGGAARGAWACPCRACAVACCGACPSPRYRTGVKTARSRVQSRITSRPHGTGERSFDRQIRASWMWPSLQVMISPSASSAGLAFRNASSISRAGRRTGRFNWRRTSGRAICP